MASYDYRCRSCGTTFEVQRSITADPVPVRCPDGHQDAARVWSAVAFAGGAAGPAAGAMATPAPAGGGGCCGGGCCG